jgi:DNA-binding XRE family transcriptional regulator
MKIWRHSEDKSIRDWAEILHVPFTTLSAVETGRAYPSMQIVSAFSAFLSLSPKEMYKIANRLLFETYEKETMFRLIAANPFVPLSLCALMVYYDFFNSVDQSEKLQYTIISKFSKINSFNIEDIFNEKRGRNSFLVEVYLQSKLFKDLNEFGELSSDLKVLLLLYFTKGLYLIKAGDVLRYRLTEPPPKRILHFLPPVVARRNLDLLDVLNVAKKKPVNQIEYVIDPYFSLDILLTMCSNIIIDPLKPGVMTVYYQNYAGISRSCTVYYPPNFNTPIQITSDELSVKIEDKEFH